MNIIYIYKSFLHRLHVYIYICIKYHYCNRSHGPYRKGKHNRTTYVQQASAQLPFFYVGS